MNTPCVPRIWLDYLPDDVCNRIVAFLPKSRYPKRLEEDVVSLARASNQQSRIFIGAMDNKFDLLNVRCMLKPEIMQSWFRVLASYIHHLSIIGPQEFEITGALRLLEGPVLRTLSTSAEPGVLETIWAKQSLRELRLIDAYPSITFVSLSKRIPLLFSTLSSLNLSTLHLDCMAIRPSCKCDVDCDYEERNECGFARLLKDDSDPAALGRCCRKVQTLSIKCPHTTEWEPLPTFLDGFLKLRDFTPDFVDPDFAITQTITPSLAAKLRTLESVHLRHIDLACRSAGDIGASVKTLVCSDWKNQKLYEGSELAVLSNCPNLITLSLCMKPGVEKWFSDVAQKLTCLRSLDFNWDIRIMHRPEELVEVAYEYHCPSPDLLHAIQEMPKLTSLSLVHVTLPIGHVTNMLKVIGDRLKSFTISIRGQDEPLEERLTLLMEEMAKSNQELRQLSFKDTDDVRKDRRRRKRRRESPWGSDTPFPIMESRMQRAFNQLRRNARSLDWKSVVRSALRYYKLKLVPGIGMAYMNPARPIPDSV